MITFNLYEFIDALEDNKKIIAIDLGTKSIGFAISDKNLKFVEDFSQYKSLGINNDINFFHQKNLKENFAGFVLGTPFSHTRKNGWINFITDFATKLHKKINIPIYMKDESFSTQNIAHLIKDLSRKARKRWKDKLAASCILEETLCTIRDYRDQIK